MGIVRENLFGNASIGPYLALNNEIMFYPHELPDEKLKSIKKAFPEKFPSEPMKIWNSTLVGSYMVMNSKGILLPSIILDEEISELKDLLKKHGLESNYKIQTLEVKDNALGNLILCNNSGAIISESLLPHISAIQETLDVPILPLNYAGNHLAGSSGIANNKGCLVHPNVTDNEAKMIEDILKVPVDVTTVNLGDPFVRSGAVVNDLGGIFGSKSSGPELMRLTNVLEL